jgi:glutamyl-tRNA reductase
MFCISINHKNTPADVRESFAFSTKGQRQFTERLKAVVGGCVVLSTCNRMEIYFTDKCEPCGSAITGKMSSGEASGGRGGLLEQVEMLLANDRDVPVSLIRRYSMNYEGFQCMLHLCRVACGMDSMVLGEVEIIHQVKSAYLVAKKLGACDGELNIAFQGALAAAKAVATESDATRLPVSVGTLSAREAVSFIRNRGTENTCRDVRRDEADCKSALGDHGEIVNAETARAGYDDGVYAENTCTGNILVVGATGKIGSIVVKDIADLAPDIEITGTSRSHHSADSIFDRHQQIRIEDYSRRYELAAWADVIISATASPHYTFVRDELAEAVKMQPKRRLLLDLAMPKDIDPAVSDVDGCVLRDIDYIRTLSRENNESRAKTITEMEPWLISQVDEIMKNIAFSRFNREHGDVMAKLKTIDGAKMVYKLKGQLEYDAFEKMLDSIVTAGCEN